MKLLVSVRTPREAEAALSGGADLIDVKEPANGPLGAADDNVILQIAAMSAGRRPVSVAMGELENAGAPRLLVYSCAFLKFGLAKSGGNGWRRRLKSWQNGGGPAIVPAAYADAAYAASPDVEEIVEFSIENRLAAMLIDTHQKHGGCLFDWISAQKLQSIHARLRAAGCQFAIAGSLTTTHWPAIREVSPDWIGVRGAVCASGERLSTIDRDRVAQLKALCVSASG